MKQQRIGSEIDDENDDPNLGPGPSKRTNHARRGRKPKMIMQPRKPKRHIYFTQGKCLTIKDWIMNSKPFAVVDLEEELQIKKEGIARIDDINRTEEFPDITANVFNRTNKSEKNIKDSDEEENNEIEIVEINESDQQDEEMDGMNEERREVKKKVNKRKDNEPPAPIYTDLDGNEWNLLAPSGYLKVHYPLLGMEKCFETKNSTFYKCVHRYEFKCPHLMLLLKKMQLFYQRFEHSHQMETTLADLLKGKTPSPKKVGPDADLAIEMELTGWKCIDQEMANEEKLNNKIKEEGMRRRAAPHNEIFQKFDCKERRCGFKMQWLKRRSELWAIGVHNRHPAIEKKLTKKRRMRKSPKW